MQAAKAFLVLILGLLLGVPAAAEPQQVDPASLRPSHQHQQVAVIVKGVVEKYHYKKQSLDDAWSERILERYLEALDAKFEAGAKIDGEAMAEAGLVKYADRPIKLLGRGKVEKSFQVEVAKASKTAIAAVEAAGGSVTVAG